MKVRYGCVFLIILFIGLPFNTGAAEPPFFSMGLRGGINSRNHFENEFSQFSAFLDFGTPWVYEWDSEWTLQPVFDLAGGVIATSEVAAAQGSLALELFLSSPEGAFTLSLGGGIGAMSEHIFEDVDLGGPIFFNPHIGARVKFAPNAGIGYRWYHQSNAGIYENNPGLNLHQLELRFWF